MTPETPSTHLSVTTLQQDIRQTNASKGWGKHFSMNVQENPVVLVALITTEIREATDELTLRGAFYEEDSTEALSLASLELGDAIVRTLDLASLMARETPELRPLQFTFSAPATEITPLRIGVEEIMNLYTICAQTVQDGRRHGPDVYLQHLERLLGELNQLLARHGRDAAQITAYLNARNAGREFKHGGARY